MDVIISLHYHNSDGAWLVVGIKSTVCFQVLLCLILQWNNGNLPGMIVVMKDLSPLVISSVSFSDWVTFTEACQEAFKTSIIFIKQEDLAAFLKLPCLKF